LAHVSPNLADGVLERVKEQVKKEQVKAEREKEKVKVNSFDM
jgi:hypothetical protein